ncbi:hypothetical protein ACQR1I_17610 [Bradyrhizobium sp. HKCCYLS2038]
MIAELAFEAVARVATATCLVTGRAVLIAASLGKIRTGPFWGGRKAGRFGLVRDPNGHVVVGDVWAILSGAVIWAVVIASAWWLL